MKKRLFVLFVFVCGLVAGRLLQKDPASAQGVEETKCIPPLRHTGGALVQDVNGDGGYDISDAICILSYLFLGTCNPTSICLGQMPVTGQNVCYDDVGNVIDCTNIDFPGQDGFYQAGCSSNGRFWDNQDGTITDSCTGLMWQKEAVPDMQSWHGALLYSEGLELAGHNDWRLPNVLELQSIINYGRSAPSIDPIFVADLSSPPYWYWSSSTPVESPNTAWVVSLGCDAFGCLRVDDDYKSTPHSIRAVRKP